MKALYIIKLRNTIKYTDKHNKQYVISRNGKYSYSKLMYGEIPDETSRTYFAEELHDIAKECCYNVSKTKYNLNLLHFVKKVFHKNKYEIVALSDFDSDSKYDIHIDIDNIDYVVAARYAEVYDINQFSFDYIMKNLNAEDFMDFCRDYGLNCVTVYKENGNE